MGIAYTSLAKGMSDDGRWVLPTNWPTAVPYGPPPPWPPTWPWPTLPNPHPVPPPGWVWEDEFEVVVESDSETIDYYLDKDIELTISLFYNDYMAYIFVGETLRITATLDDEDIQIRASDEDDFADSITVEAESLSGDYEFYVGYTFDYLEADITDEDDGKDLVFKVEVVGEGCEGSVTLAVLVREITLIPLTTSTRNRKVYEEYNEDETEPFEYPPYPNWLDFWTSFLNVSWSSNYDPYASAKIQSKQFSSAYSGFDLSLAAFKYSTNIYNGFAVSELKCNITDYEKYTDCVFYVYLYASSSTTYPSSDLTWISNCPYIIVDGTGESYRSIVGSLILDDYLYVMPFMSDFTPPLVSGGGSITQECEVYKGITLKGFDIT